MSNPSPLSAILHLYPASNPNPSLNGSALEITERHWGFPEFLQRVTADLQARCNNAKTPKDIEDTIASEFNFVKLINHKVATASEADRTIYSFLGVKINEIPELYRNAEIAQNWIEWFKAKRSKDIAKIRNVEAFLPVNPDCKILQCSFSPETLRPVVKTSLPVEGTSYRLYQAINYARILFNIFCAPSSAPAPGEPLEDPLLIPEYSSIPAPRSAFGAQIFRNNETYAFFEARIAKIFLQTAITEGSTSVLLPHVEAAIPDGLPKDHPVRLDKDAQ